MCGEQNSTTMHEITAMSAEENPEPKNVRTDVESIQQCEAHLLREKS